MVETEKKTKKKEKVGLVAKQGGGLPLKKPWKFPNRKCEAVLGH